MIGKKKKENKKKNKKIMLHNSFKEFINKEDITRRQIAEALKVD